VTGSNRLVSVAFNGGSSGNNRSEYPILTADGRHVIFQSMATNLLATRFGNGRYQVYAHDRVESRTILVSRSPTLNYAPAPSTVAVSARGNRVAFTGGSPSCLYLCDLEADPSSTNLLVATRAVDPSLSADGRWIAYQQLPTTGAPGQIWVKDALGSGAACLASVNGTGTDGGNGHSASPTLDPSGRFVAFRSQASDLVGGDTNGWSDVFVRDLLNSVTLLVSVNRTGSSGGNRLSASPVLGWDPNAILFHSHADDLVAADLNQQGDLFLFRFEQGDSDGDGLPDGWEWTYFGELSRDGSQDSDDDGLTDREEYWAGTNPTNDASLLRVIAITALSTSDTQLIWSAAPTKQYRVQYLDALGGAWEDLSAPVTVNGQQGSAIDSSANLRLHRFYRVVALP
jgi:hypothetical protein